MRSLTGSFQSPAYRKPASSRREPWLAASRGPELRLQVPGANRVSAKPRRRAAVYEFAWSPWPEDSFAYSGPRPIDISATDTALARRCEPDLEGWQSGRMRRS